MNIKRPSNRQPILQSQAHSIVPAQGSRAAATAQFGAVVEFTEVATAPPGGVTFQYSNAGISTTQATYDVWIKTTAKTQQMIFQTAYIQPFIYMQNDQLGVIWDGAGPAAGWLSADTTPISDGEWHHIAVVFEHNNITFYKDGIPTSDSLSVSTITNASQPVNLGGSWSGIPSFVGRMWNVKIWALALSQQTILENVFNSYTDGQYPAGLELMSSFNVAAQSASNLINAEAAAVVKAGISWDSLPAPQVFGFNLTGNKEDIVKLGMINVVKSNSATFECWMRMSVASGVSKTLQPLMSCDWPGGADLPTAHIQYAGGDQLGVSWGSQALICSDTTPISDGAWHHIAVVFNQGVITFYKDGIPASQTSTMSSNVYSGTAVLIGAAFNAANSFHGEIYDARVWNVIRSLSNIQSNMHTILQGNETGLVALANLSYWNPLTSTTIFNQVSKIGGELEGNAKVVEIVDAPQPPVPQNVWTYGIDGIAPLGPAISPNGLVYAENVAASGNTPAGNYLHSLDLQTHAVNWTYSVHDNSSIPTPVIPASVSIGNTTAYVAAQAQDTSSAKLVELHAVDLVSGTAVWDTPAQFGAGNALTKPVEAGSIVVMGANYIDPETLDVGAALFWVDSASGAAVGQYTDIGGIGSFMTDPVIQNVGTVDKPVTMAYFATSYGTNLSLVTAIDLTNQTLVWGKNPHHIPSGGITIDQNHVYVTCSDGAIVAMNLADGSIAWTVTKTNLAIQSKPVVIGTAVHYGSTDGILYALDCATGDELWQMNTGSAIISDLIVEDGDLYFANRGAGSIPPTFYTVDPASQGSDAAIYPVPEADTILFAQGQSNGVVYFYGRQTIYAVNMAMVLHEFNIDTKLTVEDYDTTTSKPVGNDTSYRITLALNDPLKMPRVNQSVKIWSSGTLYLSNITDGNGAPTQIGPDTPLWVQTNGSGEVSLAVSAYDDGSHGGTGSSTTSPLVNCPAVYAWANFMMPAEAIVIYPDQEHMANLSLVQGESSAAGTEAGAAAGTRYLNQATAYDGSLLISSAYQNSQSLTNIASTIRNTIGTRNTGNVSAVRGQQPSPAAAKYISYPGAMPNVNYTGDNTQPATRLFVPGADSTFTMDLTIDKYQPGVFDPNPPGGDLPSTSIRGEQLLGLSLHDFIRNVVKGAERVAKVAWQWTVNAVNTVIHTAENLYTLTIATLEDAVTAVVGLLKTVVADIRKVIEWLSALFDWGAIIANHNLILSYVTNQQGTGMLDKMQTWFTNEAKVLGTDQSDITQMFGQVTGKGQSGVTSAGQSVAGQTVQSVQAPNSNVNAAYNTDANGNPTQNNATQCKFMHHKTMENIGSSAPTLQIKRRLIQDARAARIASAASGRLSAAGQVADGPDIDAVLKAWATFFASVGDTVAQDFSNFPAQLQASISTLQEKFKDPKSMLGNALTDILAVLEVIADDMINLGLAIAQAFLNLINALLTQLKLWLNQSAPNIPFVSRLYRSLTGNSLTNLDVVALISAVPATILLEVITGQKTPGVTLAAAGDLKAAAASEVGQIFLGILNFLLSVFGALFDSWMFMWNGTGQSGPVTNLGTALDLVTDFMEWIVGMCVSFAWNEWSAKDWGYWGAQAFPLGWSFFQLVVTIASPAAAIPLAVEVPIDISWGVSLVIMSAVFAAEWPASYFDAPKAPGLVLAGNIFSSLGSAVEVAYYTFPVVGQSAAADLGAIGKLTFDAVSAILGFTSYVLTVVHPLSTLDEGTSGRRALSSPLQFALGMS